MIEFLHGTLLQRFNATSGMQRRAAANVMKRRSRIQSLEIDADLVRQIL
jgi:hypothetical protein